MFNYSRRIFSYECDIYGHLNNAEYLKLFEEARSEALTEIGYSLFVTSRIITHYV